MRGKAYSLDEIKAIAVPLARQYGNPGMHRRARRPFDYQSAGGDMCVAEEQMKFASAINLWP